VTTQLELVEKQIDNMLNSIVNFEKNYNNHCT